MDVEALKSTITNIKTWGVVGDLATLIILGLGLVITYYWQKQQVTSLKDYIYLWKPSKLKEDIDAYVSIKDEMNKASLDHYKSELDKSLNKGQEALKIINELQERNTRLWKKLSKYEAPDVAEIVPAGVSLNPEMSKDSVEWTMKYKDKIIKKFKFPLNLESENKVEPSSK